MILIIIVIYGDDGGDDGDFFWEPATHKTSSCRKLLSVAEASEMRLFFRGKLHLKGWNRVGQHG